MKSNIPKNFISSNIYYLRNTRKMTQTQLGKLMDKDYSTIGKWENNINQPSIEDTFKLAMIFNVEWHDFVLKDLSTNEEIKLTNKDFKDILKKKGMIDEDDNISEEDAKKLIDFAIANKDFIIKKEDK